MCGMTMAEEAFELCLQKVFFIFGKHYTVFFGGEWGGGRCLGSDTDWIQRKCNFSVICYGIRGSELSLQALSLLPQG